MQTPRYLTKSRFKIGLECPTKLFYTKKDQYPDSKLDDKFLAALAKGGFQVGELAKCYFPGGTNIDELDYQIALQKTHDLLSNENAIIYEAAFLFQNLFIRTDIVVKKGNVIEVYEVKAKSADSINESLTIKSGLPNSGWKDYVYDIAFQRHVVSGAMPGYKIKTFLLVADKSKVANVDGLNQKFLLYTDETGQTKVKVSGDISLTALGIPILCAIPTDEIIDKIYAEDVFDVFFQKSFKELISLYADHYQKDILLQGQLKAYCRKCEFKTTESEENLGFLSGFKECWKRVHGFSDKDFAKPSVLDIWNYRGKDQFILEKRFFQSQIIPEDLLPKTVKKTPDKFVGLSNSDRQILQITKSKDNDHTIYIDLGGLAGVYKTFNYPLHFIDFETTAVAIPFHKGRRPYEQVAFQYSHHIVYEDGIIEHKGQWINADQGKFPNFEFVRQLKNELEQDSGTIFRYAAHENSILNAIYSQLDFSDEPDKAVLMEWIKTITKSTEKSTEKWEGLRNMVDLCEMVKRYYFAPQTNGSNSIKHVLPAILNFSDFLKEKYSKPIYGENIKSLNFTSQIWVNVDENQKVINPYELLNPIFEGVDMDFLDDLLTHEEGEIRDGGAAMIAYAQMQFTEMSITERMLIQKALLKYCELDTLAMVMIWEDWKHKLTYLHN
jgi:hypothetical protein